MKSLCNDIDHKMHLVTLNFYYTGTHGKILSIITNDVDTVKNAISQNLTQIVTLVVTVIGILIMMLRINVYLTLIAVVMVLVSILAAAGIMKASSKYYSEEQNMLGRLNGFIEEMYSGTMY